MRCSCSAATRGMLQHRTHHGTTRHSSSNAPTLTCCSRACSSYPCRWWQSFSAAGAVPKIGLVQRLWPPDTYSQALSAVVGDSSPAPLRCKSACQTELHGKEWR